jgi:hypothetical protein
MAGEVEIFLSFCCACGTVNASQRRPERGRPTFQMECAVCQTETTFAIVAIDFKAKKFVTKME